MIQNSKLLALTTANNKDISGQRITSGTYENSVIFSAHIKQVS